MCTRVCCWYRAEGVCWEVVVSVWTAADRVRPVQGRATSARAGATVLPNRSARFFIRSRSAS